MAEVRIGVAGQRYREWRGVFHPSAYDKPMSWLTRL
jgi:hypothetical protein